MTPAQVIQRNHSKSNFFQLMKIDRSALSDFTELFSSLSLNWEKLSDVGQFKVIIVDAAEELGRSLRKFKNYEFCVLNNKQLINILKNFNDTGFRIDNLDFLGISDMDEEKIEKIENFFPSNNFNEIIDFIQNERIAVNKIVLSKNSTRLTIYRTGLLWYSGEIFELKEILNRLIA